jgi:DNA-binding GntR family transcriptional regulator
MLMRMKRQTTPTPTPRARDSSIRSRAYLYIQQLIANGSLAAGSGVSELDVARELGSSRTPIREAMTQLAAEGLLRLSPGGGMVVAQLTRQDIVELYELREALETYAVCKMAGVQMHPAAQKKLQQLVDEILNLRQELVKSKRKRLDEKQMERFIGCDLGFHALLIGMAENSRLQKIVNETRLLISIFAIHRSGHDADALKEIHRYHQKILDAVLKQDGPAAMKLLAQHIQASRHERLNEYENWKRESTLQQSIPVFFDIHK